MVYIRGNPLDYDDSARIPGLEHWTYPHCQPCFRKAETRHTGAMGAPEDPRAAPAVDPPYWVPSGTPGRRGAE